MVYFDQASLAVSAAIISCICFLVSLTTLFKSSRAPFLKMVYALGLILSLAAISIIIGKPYTLSLRSQSHAMFLIDVSDSMPGSVSEELIKQASNRAEQYDHVEVLPFAGTSSKQAATSIPSSFRSFKRNNESLDLGATNLAAALSATSLSAAQHIYLVSDGWETAGNALEYIKQNKKDGQRLYPFISPVIKNSQQEIIISQVSAPQMQASGSKAKISVVVENTKSSAEQVSVQLSTNEETIQVETLKLTPNSSRLITLETDQLEEGPHEYFLDLKTSHQQKDNEQKSVFISGTPREKVLLLNSDPDEARVLERALRNQHFQLESKLAKENYHDSSPKFSDFEAVVFNNVPRTDFSSDMPNNLRAYVEAGGNFIMIGGNKSFGLGNYRETPVEDILPVKILPPQKKTKRLNVAVLLLLDKSGSMRSEQKLDFVKIAAREVIGSLKDGDYIGIIGIDDAPFITQQIGRLAEVRSEANRKVGLLYAVGGTNFLPGIDIAKRHLEKVDAGRKHVIMLTDGKLPDGYSMRPYYLQLVEDMRLSGITMSTFLIGPEQGQLLREMANAGGGAFHRTRNAQTLPRLFLDDIRISTGEKTQRESSNFKVTKAAPNSIVSTSVREFPDLLGYTETKVKSQAQTELLVRSPRKADPLLASWKVKRGRSIAFTSDASGRWSQLWVKWNQYVAFWRDLIAPKIDDEGGTLKNTPLDLRYQVSKGVLHLKLTAFANRNIPIPDSNLNFPDKRKEVINWKQIAPGYYEAEVPNVMAGNYVLETYVEGTTLTSLGFNLSGTLFGEQLDKGFNSRLLYRLAAMTEGKVNPTNSDLVNSNSTTSVKEYIDSKLAIYALLFLFLAIVARERLRRYGVNL